MALDLVSHFCREAVNVALEGARHLTDKHFAASRCNRIELCHGTIGSGFGTCAGCARLLKAHDQQESSQPDRCQRETGGYQ